MSCQLFTPHALMYRPMEESAADALGLVPTHAYAVLQVRAACGVQLLQLKNPWARKRWRGAFSVFDRQRWTPELRKAFGFDQQASLQQDNGIFWIDYDSLLRHFEGVFLNWNPQLFKHHTVTHGQWPPRAAFRDDAVDLGTNPQYQLTVNVPPAGAATAVWVLLTRHSSRPYNLAMAEGRDASRDAFLTVHVFRGGARAHYLERCWMQGVYSNRPHTLVKFDLPAASAPQQLTLALAQYKPTDSQVDFSLDVYAQAPFTLRPIAPPEPTASRLTGAWSGRTAGGSSNHDSYVDNPRFLLELPFAASPVLELAAVGLRGGGSKPEDVQLGLALSPEAPTEQPAGDARKWPLRSGDYRPGGCRLAAASLPAGRWLVVPSTFTPGTECGFELRASAGRLAALPHEAHGLQRQAVQGAWDRQSAAGSPNHGAFWKNPQLQLVLSRPAELLLRLRAPGTREGRSAAPPSLCVALFDGGEQRTEATGRGLSRARAVSEGGLYAYPAGGACLPRTPLPAGMYAVLLSTFDPYVGPWELVMYATEGTLRVASFR
mmetsp:Transcript_34635/g.114109  ORF Transcript_34635/g.114109 Transcript_34635/m.114109 type:complete len:546 (-) Transcript_34635:104-1741(-)